MKGVGIGPPFSDQQLHVFRKFAFEKHFLPGGRVDKADGLGMEGMPGADGETIVHKLPVFIKNGPFNDLIAAIRVVIE